MTVQVDPDPQGCWQYPISTSGTFVVKNGPGTFIGVICSNAGTTWTVTGYDNTAASGTLMTAGAVTMAVGTPNVGIPAGSGINFVNGLTIVTAGTAGALSILYR